MNKINSKKQINNDKNYMLFSISEHEKLGLEVSKILNVNLSKVSKTIFSDKEILIKSLETVRNKSIYVICSTYSSDTIIELLLFIDSLKRASASKINIIITYFGYSRQDRKASQREPIGAKLMSSLIERAGATKVITFDLHNPSIQGFFDLPVDSIQWIYCLKKYLKEHKEFNLNNLTIVSPDHGGAVRARKLADLLQNSNSIAIIDKRRTGPNVSEIMGLLGDVKDKDCLIFDDMIDTGGTIMHAAEFLKEKGAKQIFLASTHGIFSKGFDLFENNKFIDKVFVSDSIPNVWNIKSKKLTIISLANVIAQVIEASEKSLSISNLFSKEIK